MPLESGELGLPDGLGLPGELGGLGLPGVPPDGDSQLDAANSQASTSTIGARPARTDGGGFMPITACSALAQ